MRFCFLNCFLLFSYLSVLLSVFPKVTSKPGLLMCSHIIYSFVSITNIGRVPVAVIKPCWLERWGIVQQRRSASVWRHPRSVLQKTCAVRWSRTVAHLKVRVTQSSHSAQYITRLVADAFALIWVLPLYILHGWLGIKNQTSISIYRIYNDLEITVINGLQGSIHHLICSLL